MRCGDKKHLGAMRGERAAAHRTGDDAGEVEHLDAGERAIRRGEFLGGASPIFSMRKQRQLRDRLALRMAIPFGERAARGDDETGFGGRGLERLGRQTVERALHRGLVVGTPSSFRSPLQ